MEQDLITNPGRMIRSSSSFHGFDLTNVPAENSNHITHSDSLPSKRPQTRRVNSYGALIRVNYYLSLSSDLVRIYQITILGVMFSFH